MCNAVAPLVPDMTGRLSLAKIEWFEYRSTSQCGWFFLQD